mmetsp:Transcript_8905/g.19607  ORF Transcript_8905/g.19607 Transcript_8905/m.19607 type:complete len:336 (-) Transcript_8905:294-1301(-)
MFSHSFQKGIVCSLLFIICVKNKWSVHSYFSPIVKILDPCMLISKAPQPNSLKICFFPTLFDNVPIHLALSLFATPFVIGKPADPHVEFGQVDPQPEPSETPHLLPHRSGMRHPPQPRPRRVEMTLQSRAVHGNPVLHHAPEKFVERVALDAPSVRQGRSLHLVVVVIQQGVGIRLGGPPEAPRYVSRPHLPQEHVVRQRPVRRDRLVDHVPKPYPPAKMSHRREDMTADALREPRRRKVLQKRRGGDVPDEHVALDGQAARERPVDQVVGVVEVVASLAEARAAGERAREGVAEGGPFEVMFHDYGVEFRPERAAVGWGEVGGGVGVRFAVVSE